jgi:hypothetical protein
MSKGVRAGKIIDSHNFYIGFAQQSAEGDTADSAESIDCYFYLCHINNDLKVLFLCKSTVFF